MSLQNLSRMMYKIDEQPDGKFRVTLPTPIDTRMGVSVGTFSRISILGMRQKRIFLQERRNEERLTKETNFGNSSRSKSVSHSLTSMLLIQKLRSETTLDVPPAIGKYFIYNAKS